MGTSRHTQGRKTTGDWGGGEKGMQTLEVKKPSSEFSAQCSARRVSVQSVHITCLWSGGPVFPVVT